MDSNPFDIVQRRQEAERQRVINEHYEFDTDHIERSIAFFNSALKRFVTHLAENEYPYADVRTIDDRQYLSFRLFDTSRSDGESHYENGPLTVLLDEHHNVSYLYETSPEGYYNFNDSPPLHIEMPTNADEYRQAFEDYKFKRDISRDGTDMLEWGVRMLHQIEQFKTYGHTLTPADWYRGGGERASIYKAMIEQIFPDGENIYDRRRYLQANG